MFQSIFILIYLENITSKNRLCKVHPPILMNSCDTLSGCCHASCIRYCYSCWGQWDVFAQPDYNLIGSLGNDLH